ncbi:MAG: hypothetical protein JNK87_11585 [Bryobacterales bacterium]|nr:hypothetical protein [Bryobacterales bacterium]
MNQNLDTLKREIPEHLHGKGLAVFRGFVNELHEQKLVFWDVEREGDYRLFVQCALDAGVKLVIFNHRDFERPMVEEALERLEECDMPREEQRAIERRLKELRAFDGFTCAVELVFERENRFYVFDLRTEWYEELLDLLDTIDGAAPIDDLGEEEEDDESMGGYFSRN